MKLILDHVFILTDEFAHVADALVSLGLKESFSRDHSGQGTSNRRFEFSNSMLEFLWVRDSDEAENGPARDLQFPKRASESAASPFGIILCSAYTQSEFLPYPGWAYQPDYFKPPMAFHIGNNSTKLDEPLCIFAPFIKPKENKPETGLFQSISNVTIQIATTVLSPEMQAASKACGLTIRTGKEHLMEIVLDNNRLSKHQDFRPNIPLIVHW